MGYVLGVGNPKAYAAMGALFSGFTLVPDPLLDAAAKMATLTVIIAAVDLVWVFTGQALSRLAVSRTTRRVINLCFALALVVSVALAVLA